MARALPVVVIRTIERSSSWLRYRAFKPLGIGALGDGSFIGYPRRILGRHRIHVGARTYILGESWLMAHEQYAGVIFDSRVSIGNDVYIGRHFTLSAAIGVTIGDGSVISDNVYIGDTDHGFAPDRGLILKQPLTSRGAISIGAHSFIGYGSVVLSNVVLGEHCVVGSNSVVTRSFPAHSRIGGVPARLLGSQ
ncbi:MAG: acyltransferase [Solirubrobacteraceae bacterium]